MLGEAHRQDFWKGIGFWKFLTSILMHATWKLEVFNCCGIKCLPIVFFFFSVTRETRAQPCAPFKTDLEQVGSALWLVGAHG